MKIRSTLLAVAAAGATMTMLTPPALAAGPERVAIQYRDLNLNHAAGRATLDQRIDAAARRACSSYVGTNLAEQQGRNNCVAEITSQFRAQAAGLTS